MDLFEQASAARYVSGFVYFVLWFFCVILFLLLQKTNLGLNWVPNSSKRARRCDVDVFLANRISTEEVFDSDVDTDDEAPTAKVICVIHYFFFYGILRDCLFCFVTESCSISTATNYST